MKKLLVLFVGVSFLPSFALAQKSDDSFLVKNVYGDVNVGYAVKTKNQTYKNYAGLGINLSFLTWKNEYKDSDGVVLETESFNFKPLTGVSGVIGVRPADKWRADLEFGYVGKFSDSEVDLDFIPYILKTQFDMVTYNITVNGYYEFWRGIYAGVGAGMAMVKTTLDDTLYPTETDTSVSPMGALMLGWSESVGERADLDFRYRVALFHGGNVIVGGIKIEEDNVTDMSLSVGLRYNF